MTVILAVKKPLMMFGDSLCNYGDVGYLTSDKVEKIIIPYDGDSLLYDYKIPQEGMNALIGSAGELQSSAEFKYWCKQGLNKNTRPHFSFEHGMSALLLLQSGVLLRFDHQCFPYKIEDEYCAVGAGRDIVLGAIEAYLDKELLGNVATSDIMRKTFYYASMMIAAKFNIYTAEPIHCVEL